MIAKTPSPPYYAVIFSSVRTQGDNGYSEMSERMSSLSAEQEGFLGIESARDRLGITVSYWRDLDSIKNWRDNPEHTIARMKGRSDWYSSFRTRIARVERDYEFVRDHSVQERSFNPVLNKGRWVYCSAGNASGIDQDDILFFFREKEGATIVLKQEAADRLELEYSFIASWITLDVFSSLEAVGLTSVFSKALADKGIGCNVVAAFNHDHIFVNQNDASRAMEILNRLSW